MPEKPFEIVLDNHLHAVWEKGEALMLSVYNVNVGWVERRPTTAPQIVRKLADDIFEEVVCKLLAIASDIAAEDKRFAESLSATVKGYAEAIGMIERDQLTKRLGEIVRSPHEPPEPTT
jgi:hypothetical protein